MNIRTYTLLTTLCFTIFAIACGSKPATGDNTMAKKPETASATPAASPTRAPAAITDGESVDKEQKLSFSTYDTNWPSGWQFIDPDENADSTQYDVKTGVLRMVVPSGKDLHGDNMTAPRYVKAIKGNFRIDTTVRAKPSENYQGAGLLVFSDKTNYIRLERAFGGTDGGGSGIRLDIRKNDEYSSITTPDDIPYDGAEVELRFVKSGNKITAYWRADENAEWRQVGEAELPTGDTVLAGLIVCNTASEFEAKFVDMTIAPVDTTN